MAPLFCLMRHWSNLPQVLHGIAANNSRSNSRACGIFAPQNNNSKHQGYVLSHHPAVSFQVSRDINDCGFECSRTVSLEQTVRKP
ncbi:MAG: hypothetical protein [Olavius algarvensis Gamma 3 endosymbiont]|nr:MAG: hypothetical protein [Olavius algarvensis Gamma 3 endosymbiont]